MDPVKGLVLVLYPTDNPDRFEGEGFCRIEDRSAREVIERSVIKDKIWLALLADENIPERLSQYPVEMLGAYPSGSYKLGGREEYRTFHIVEKEEPQSKTG